MSLVLRSCRKIRGARFSPDAVWLTREQPLNTSVYEAFFGCPVSFGSGVYKMRFQRADVDAPLPWGNVELAIANDRIVQQHLAKLNTASVTQRLNALLVRELHTGLRTQADCARALGMSVRSLQRSLSDEQTSFREVLELVRYSLAERYLRTEPRPSLTEIAFMLGFSESSSFSRAYSRWTGCPPSAVS